ncbi:hypothetical protein V7075_02220 [Neobacillus drentensis]
MPENYYREKFYIEVKILAAAIVIIDIFYRIIAKSKPFLDKKISRK